MEQIPAELFSGLINLESLNMRNNVKVDIGIFVVKLSFLEILNLSYNRTIEYVKDYALHGLYSFKMLI